MNPTKLPNKVYDVAKYIAQIGLPALATLVASLWSIWHWPNGDAIVKTIVAMDLFLGTLLLISSVQYNRSKENTP